MPSRGSLAQQALPKLLALLLACVAGGGSVSTVSASTTPDAVMDPAPSSPQAVEGTGDDGTQLRGKAYAHLMRAVFAAKRGELRTAAHEIRQAVELQPDSPDLRVEGARLFSRMGRRVDAERVARDALELDPEHRDALRLLGDLVAERALMGNRPDARSREEALSLYGALIERGERDEQVLRKVVSLRLQGGDRAGAIDAARLLVESRPGDRNATGLLAQLLLEQGQETDALRIMLEFVARHPDDVLLLERAAELARALDAWQMVDDVFMEHADFDERPGPAQRLHGEALLRLFRVDEAIAALEAALAADPEDRSLQHNLARAYLAVGRRHDAAELLRSVTRESPGDAEAQFLLGETLDSQDDVEGALNAFAVALRLFGTVEHDQAVPVRDELRRRMALLYLENEHRDLASQLLDELERPDQGDLLELRARVAIADEDGSAARQAIRRLRAAGEGGTADLLEAELQLRSGRLSRAEPKIRDAIEALGPSARVTIGELFLELGRAGEGEVFLREWVAAEPDSAAAHYYLGSYLYRADRFDEAELALREAFRLNPEHGPALNFLGYSMAEQRDRLDEALALIQRALAIDRWNGAYLDSLGWVYYQLGEYDEAREPLEQAAREYPKDSTVLEHLGDLYDKLGERDLALTYWKKALETGAENVDGLEVKIAREESAPNEVGEVVPEPIDSRRRDEDPPLRP